MCSTSTSRRGLEVRLVPLDLPARRPRGISKADGDQPSSPTCVNRGPAVDPSSLHQHVSSRSASRRAELTVTARYALHRQRAETELESWHREWPGSQLQEIEAEALVRLRRRDELAHLRELRQRRSETSTTSSEAAQRSLRHDRAQARRVPGPVEKMLKEQRYGVDARRPMWSHNGIRFPASTQSSVDLDVPQEGFVIGDATGCFAFSDNLRPDLSVSSDELRASSVGNCIRWRISHGAGRCDAAWDEEELSARTACST